MKSRNSVLLLLNAFVSAWNQLMTARNCETKQLHPKRLTLWSKGHRCFWEGGRARSPASSSSRHSTCSRWSSYQALAVASHRVRYRPAAVTILEPHENSEWRSGLVGTGLLRQDKALLQSAPLRFDRPGVLLCDGTLQPLREISSPAVNRHRTTACAGRHTPTVVPLCPRAVN
jgi:hypothetical protein